MKRILYIVLATSPFVVAAQGFLAKTNEIQLDFVQGVPDSPGLPNISWVSPQFEYSNSKEYQVDVEGFVNSDMALKSVRIVIGDNTSGDEKGSKEYSLDNPHSLHFKQRINLAQDGSHFIRIVAENEKGAKVASTRTVVVGMDAIALSIDRKDYALLFATDKYDHWDDLVNPVDDSRAIARELQEKYGFQTELVENADIEHVFEKLREYSQRKFRPQDQLLIFFAGHGAFDDTFGEGYVVAKNSLANDRSKTTYISHNRLRGVINNIPSEHILLAMDVCFGGTIDPQIAKTRQVQSYEDSPADMVARKLSQKTRKYLTSGGKEYVSDGIPGKHSPFASKFIESLKGMGGVDRVLTLHELIANMESLHQVPRTGSFGDDQKLSDFVFIAK